MGRARPGTAWLVCLRLGLIGWMLVPGSVEAQSRADLNKAQRAMERGVAAAERGEHEAALVDFRQAQELVPDADLPHRFEAESLEALGRWDEAVAAYQSYLRIKPDARDRDKVLQRIEDIRAEYLEGLLDVVCHPDGAEVYIGGADQPAGVTPLRGLRLPVGEVNVEVRADGYYPLQAPTVIRAGSAAVVAGKLTPRLTAGPVGLQAQPGSPPIDDPLRAESSVQVDSPRPWYRKWYVWATAGAVVSASVGAYLVFTSGPPDSQGGIKSFP